MAQYLVTQSLIAAWAYTFDCREDGREDAMQSFLRVLNREPAEPTQAIRNGIAFENTVYGVAAGAEPPTGAWENGVRAVAQMLKGAQIQVRLSRPLQVNGMDFLVYGILDALKAGVIYDVKFKNKSFCNLDLAGSYMESPQHPLYFYLVPEAYDFRYLISDGDDLYIETYHRPEVRSAQEIVGEFIRSIESMGLLPLYKEKWLAK